MSAVERVFAEHKDQVYTYTRDLLKKLKTEGYALFAISGSQQEVIQKLADYYGFDEAIGNRYETRNGHFTGQHDRVFERKADILAELVKKHDCQRRGSIGVGDSESDIDLLAAVETPIVFNPSRRLFEQARRHGWRIVVERKNVVYELESKDGAYLLDQAG
jgi:HAD superfamily phosphoserine phosphatase-like hydrolase